MTDQEQLQQCIARLEAALRNALACGLPPHDVSGQRMWQEAREALADEGAGGGERRTLWNSDPHNRTELPTPTPEQERKFHEQAQRREAIEALETLVDAAKDEGGWLWPDVAEHEAQKVRRYLTAPPTVPEDAPAAFVHWLVREMPPGTTIGNPGWWAPKIWREVRRALAQHSEPGRIPEGYCLVPVIPTIEMADAADKAMEETRGSAKSDCNRAILAYKRILAAAPAPDAEKNDA